MTPGSLAPASVTLTYETAFAIHSLTYPTLVWDESLGTNGFGGYQAWNTDELDAQDEINGFVDLIKVFFKSTTSFLDATIYTMTSADAPRLPRTAFQLDQVGTSAATGWEEATQQTWSFRDENFKPFKLVFLDTPMAASGFAKLTDFTGLTDVLALETYVEGGAHAFQSRQNGKPAHLYQIAYTLNEKLRREYRMN